ncbi:MAG: 30S ribosomal protein S20 [Deltaproteobacteria bacterium]|nr:30S ribosomal protein S20 [Deltaproteobacteria bacterium]
MATHKSAIKRHRQSLIRRERNNAVESTIKTATKKVHTAVESGNSEEAKTSLSAVTTLLDKAVSKNVLHRNNAARKISRLTRTVNSIASK